MVEVQPISDQLLTEPLEELIQVISAVVVWCHVTVEITHVTLCVCVRQVNEFHSRGDHDEEEDWDLTVS